VSRGLVTQLLADARELARSYSHPVSTRRVLGTDGFQLLLIQRLRTSARSAHVPLVNHLLRRFSTAVYGTEIGNDVTLRENVTVHRGTTIGIGTTKIGDGSFIMAYCHVAHDCVIGKRVIMANSVQCAGHVEVGDGTFLGGTTVVAQFVRIGAYCYIGGASGFNHDCPPFVIGRESPLKVIGVNVIGLRRAGFSEESILKIRQIFRIFYVRKETVSKAIERVTMEFGDLPEAQLFLKFVQSSKLGITR